MDTFNENKQDKNITNKNTIEENSTIKNASQYEDSLRSLEEKYENLNREIKSLEGIKVNMEESIKTMHSDFENINKNIGSILEKLDNTNFNSEDGRRDHSRRSHSLKSLIGSPLRKLAVGTLTGIYTVADKAIEGVYDIKENTEDIFAEAQYKSKKRKVNAAEQH